MSKVLVVVAREYLQRVRTRTFVIGTIAGPVIVAAFVVVPIALEMRRDVQVQSIALVDHTGVLAGALTQRLEDGGMEVTVVAPASSEEDRARTRAAAGEIAGIVELDDATLERGRARWIGASPPSALHNFRIRQSVSQSALSVRFGGDAADASVAALLDGGSLEVVLLGRDAEASDSSRSALAAGMVGAFVLYLSLLIYGTMVLRAVLEEKTSRIAEVIVSSMQPWELMLGKVLGVGSVGLTQLAIWVLSGALILLLGLPAIVSFVPDPEFLSQVRDGLPGIGTVVFFGVCFLLGFFIYATLFAAVAAMCSSEQEAQQLQTPVVLLVVAPVVALMPILDDPTSTFAVGMSLVPFFSPVLMFARVAAGAAPFWEAALSVVFMIVTLLGTAWVAGRIYKVGILMQGKRPTLPELWRWVREA